MSRLTLPKSIYSRDAIAIAAQVFAGRAQVYLSESGARWTVELKPARAGADRAALAGEFLNEALNQEYRFKLSRVNGKLAGLIATQALIAARGAETPAAPAAEQAAEFQAEVSRLLSEAEDEIRRTMPRRIPPQGAPIPPAAETA